MSWLTSNAKKLRRAAGLPAITLGNVAKIAAPVVVPGVGGVLTAAASSGRSVMTVAREHADATTDQYAAKIAAARRLDSAVTAVQSHSGKIAAGLGGALILFLLFRRR